MTASSKTHLTWLDPQWQAQARDWVEGQLVRSDRRLTGEIEQPHLRPWSTVWRIPTDTGPVWFKANGAGSAHEPGLLRALAGWVPGRVLQPLAVDTERGWSLQPDGGRTLRIVLGHDQDLSHWERVLAEYAQLQMRVVSRVDELLALGVPDHRPMVMPSRYERLLLDRASLLIGDDDALSPQTYERLRNLLPQFDRWCQHLDQLGIGPSVQHDDLHDANIFADLDGYRFFDWGDASVGHPFGTLLVTLRSVAHSFEIPPGDRRLRRMVDAYLEPWTAEHDRQALMQSLDLALSVAKVSRSLSWQRALSALALDQRGEYAAAVPGWLAELLEPNPI